MTDPKALSVGLLRFSSLTFFLLLPPIIFNSGYHINRTLFFPLLPAISAYAIIGTSVSALFVGFSLWLIPSIPYSLAELLAFGALISATDPVSTLATFQSKKVDPVLFYLVFGESVVNDAVGLVLFETLKKFIGYSHSTTTGFIALIDFCVIFFGSTLLGILTGMISSFLFKKVDLRPYPHIEISLYVLIIYVPFIVAEVLSLSGIVTILFTGIVCKCYAHRSLTPDSKVLADGVFRILAHLAETAIFLELGLAVFGMSSDNTFHPGFIALACLACLIGRALNVYPLSFLLNRTCYTGDSSKIPMKTQHMLMYSGLRGAVAFACATTFPGENKDVFIVTTMCIVLVTVFVFGGGTESALRGLEIDVEVDENLFDVSAVPYMESGEWVSGCSEWVGRKGEEWFIREDERMILPVRKASAVDFEMTALEESGGEGGERGEESDTVGLVKLGETKKKGGVGRRLSRTSSSLFDFGVKKKG